MLLDRRIEGLVVLANWRFSRYQFCWADLEYKASIPTAITWLRTQRGLDEFGSVVDIRQKLAATSRSNICILWAIAKIAFIRGPKTLGDSSPRWRGRA